jgi:hypothetical protein
MKNLKKIALVTIAVLSFSVNADNTQEYYGGVGIAKTSLKGDGAEYDKVNLKLMGGMRINENFSAEIQLLNLSKDDLSGAGGVDAKGKSFGIAGLYYLDNSSTAKPFIKLGIHRWDVDFLPTPAHGGASSSDNGTDLFGGVGVDFALEGFTTRIEYENYKMGGDVDENMKSFGVSAVFNF